jgi:hypothetical protein
MRVPSRSVRAFFQEGVEKSTEKGSKTDKMLRDRESIALPFKCQKLKQYALWGALYQLLIFILCNFMAAER